MKHTDPEAYGRKAAEHILLKFGALEEKYLKMMGNRIREIGRVSATDVYRLEQLRDIGADMGKLKRELARDVKKTLVEIETLFESAAKRAKAPYDGLMNAKDGNALAASMAAAQFLQTGGRMVNLSGTSAMSRKYQGLVDDAVFCLQAGVEDYQSAMRSALKKAAAGGIPESGIFMDENGTRRVIYDSMHTRRLDSAVRQNVIDGVKQLFAHMTEEVGKQIGSDGVEITAHMDCAEDHLPYQGRQYTNEDFQTLQDTLKRRIGQWNCRHFAYPIVMGASEPAYTQEELETYRQNSTEEIEIDGVCKSRYRWTQEQRRLETAIRREKDCAVLAKAAGDDVLRRECQRRINEYRKHYEQVSEQAGLDVRKDRMSVSGFSHVKTVK